MFIIVWKYIIRAEYRSDYIDTYKENGKWSRLFKKSKSYKYSKLFHKDENEYLLIDAWDNEKTYSDFKKKYFEQYRSLSDEAASLYEIEEKIGEYDEII